MEQDLSVYDPAKLFKVSGMVAVITGGGTGLGLSMARALALNGAAKVYILGRRLDKLQEAAKLSPHGNIIPIQTDVTSKDELAAAARRVEAEVGYVNLVVANSGTTGPGLQGMAKAAAPPTIADLHGVFMHNWTEAQFSRPWEVNVMGAFFTAAAFLELLDKGNKAGNMPDVRSQVVVNASIASYLRLPFPYIASKAAENQIFKGLSSFLSPFGIRVNILNPGLFPTEMTEEDIASGTLKAADIPAKRMGDEADIVSATLYLCSRAGAFLNGLSLILDGGTLSVLPSTY